VIVDPIEREEDIVGSRCVGEEERHYRWRLPCRARERSIARLGVCCSDASNIDKITKDNWHRIIAKRSGRR